MNVLITQTIIMVLLVSVIFYLILYNKSLKLEKRIAKYSVDSVKDTSSSLFDILYKKYVILINKTSKILKKSVVLTKYSSRYNKYITYENDKEKIPMDYVSNKFYIAILFILLIFLAKSIAGLSTTMFEMLLSGIFGFFSLDIYFKASDHVKKRQVEQELLNAIVIMNNAFRSGRSVMQAIEIVSQELKGPIRQEFKKMYLEMNYGLSLDVVFDRFSKRVNSEEVSYITSSLSILNKTGGNIIKVFSSIEKMLFDKRKLKLEMKSLTSSASLISKVLLFMPIVFVAIISLLDSSYFMPLINTTIGRIILFIILMLYVLYIYIVNKVMKVRFL